MQKKPDKIQSLFMIQKKKKKNPLSKPEIELSQCNKRDIIKPEANTILIY